MLELEVGETVYIGKITLTVLSIEDGEAIFEISDNETGEQYVSCSGQVASF